MLKSTHTFSQLTHSKHQRLSEGDMWSASQDIPQFLENLNFHACSQQSETNPCGKPVTSSPHRHYSRSILTLSSHSCLSVANGVFLPRFQTHYFPRAGAVIVLQLTFDFVRRSVCAETRCLAGVALLHSEVHHPDTLHPQAGSSALIVDAAGPCNSESVWRCRYPHVCSVMGGCANPSHPIRLHKVFTLLMFNTPFWPTQILSTSSHPEQIPISLHWISGLH